MGSPKHQFCWNELATPNVEAAKEFYSRCFGWTFIDHKMDHGTYTMIKHGDQEFAGMWHITDDMAKDVPPHWMSYILVDDIDEMLLKVQKNGASVKVPVTKAGEFGRFAVITDPTGAHIAMWQAAGEC